MYKNKIYFLFIFLNKFHYLLISSYIAKHRRIDRFKNVTLNILKLKLTVLYPILIYKIFITQK